MIAEGDRIMAVIANRRSVMTLFSKPTCIHSHRTRLVLAEKNINIEISDVDGPDLPEDLLDLNPYTRCRRWSIVTWFCMTRASSSSTSMKDFRIRR